MKKISKDEGTAIKDIQQKCRVTFDRLVATGCAGLAQADIGSIDAMINHVLADLGRYMSATTAYFIQFQEHPTQSSVTNSWCKTAQKNLSEQPPSYSETPWFVDSIQKGETISIPQIAELPVEAKSAQQHFESLDIQSLIALPVKSPNSMLGFIGLENVTSQEAWTGDIIDSIQILGTAIAGTLERVQNESALLENSRILGRFLKNTTEYMGIVELLKQERDLRYIRINEAASYYLKVSPKKIGGMRASELGISQEVIDLWIDHCLESERQRSSVHFVYQRDAEDGIHTLEAQVSLLQPPRFLFIVSDITERKQTEDALRENQAQLFNALQMGKLGHWELDVASSIFTFSDNFYSIFKTTAEEMGGYRMSIEDYATRFVHPDDGQLVAKETRKAIETDKPEFSRYIEHRVFFADGTPGHIAVRFFIVKDAEGNTIKTFGVNQDITERKKAERDYQTLFREMLDGFAVHEIICNDKGDPVDYRFLSVNPAFERITGLKAESIAGKTVLEILPNTEPHWIETYGKVALTGEPAHFENESQELGKHFEVTAFRPAPKQFACLFVDVTDRKRAEEAKEHLQAQLTQSQKMESVGRLAGGVAHDFNNMLNVIIGRAELAMDELPQDNPVMTDLEEIHKSAKRSASLTRQLLAFARKQTVMPEILNLNETVTSMLKMLRRLIGETIALEWKPGAGLDLVCIDPGQVDQLLVNLAVNARDAIGIKMGRITIETRNTNFDEEYCDTHVELSAGDYVMLSVKDNGCGMNEKTCANIFEPFYTTKAIGEGTGLGLATVYGIVEQNHGIIDVISKPDHGADFRIYLPRYVGSNEPATQTGGAEHPTNDKQTILLVEDEPSALRMTTRMLEKLGYAVLASLKPTEAILLAETHPGTIDLLLTDVVMPEMNGRDLAEHILLIRPSIKRLFTSGYTADIIANHGALDPEVHFIPKPFTTKELAVKIIETLK